MFAQRFQRLDDIVVIEWSEPRDGYISIKSVAGVPARELDEECYRWAYRACHQRMAESGEHKDEPEES